MFPANWMISFFQADLHFIKLMVVRLLLCNLGWQTGREQLFVKPLFISDEYGMEVVLLFAFQ